MKLIVTLKTPDALDDAITEELEQFDDEEVREEAEEGVWNLVDKYFDYREYVSIEFDTVAGTATVLERQR